MIIYKASVGYNMVNVDDIGWLEYAFKGAVGIIFAIGAYMWQRLVGVVTSTKDDLAAYKTHVSENYAKSDSLERIHDRIDDVGTDVKDILKLLGTNNGR